MNVISLFFGCGGMDLGFQRAGHRILWANDIFADAVRTYRRNIGDHICEQPIERIEHHSLPTADIVIGGFPCQGFSVANVQRTPQDSRNFLYQQMLNVVEKKQPRYVVAENVKGILSLGKGTVFSMILEDFAKIGYETEYAVLNAANYGVAQIRERVFILGRRIDAPAVDFPPPPTHAKQPGSLLDHLIPWVTLDDALANLESPEQSQDPAHTFSQYKLRFNGYLGHRHVYGDRPSPTITARGDDRGGGGRHSSSEQFASNDGS